MRETVVRGWLGKLKGEKLSDLRPTRMSGHYISAELCEQSSASARTLRTPEKGNKPAQTPGSPLQ
jgi:hypothetical protein